MSEQEKNNDVIQQIIEVWTENYPPASEEEMFTIKLSSYEIAEILADYGEVQAGDVTRILLCKGYKLVRTGGGDMKWLIKRQN